MDEPDYTITTAASPAAARAYLADLRNLPDHVEAVTDVREGHDDGTFVVILGRLIGHDVIVDYVVETTEDAVVATATSHHMDSVDRWTVAPHPDGSEIRYVGDVTYKGIGKLAAPLAPLVGKPLANDLGHHLKHRLDDLETGG